MSFCGIAVMQNSVVRSWNVQQTPICPEPSPSEYMTQHNEPGDCGMLRDGSPGSTRTHHSNALTRVPPCCLEDTDRRSGVLQPGAVEAALSNVTAKAENDLRTKVKCVRTFFVRSSTAGRPACVQRQRA